MQIYFTLTFNCDILASRCAMAILVNIFMAGDREESWKFNLK